MEAPYICISFPDSVWPCPLLPTPADRVAYLVGGPASAGPRWWRDRALPQRGDDGVSRLRGALHLCRQLASHARATRARVHQRRRGFWTPGLSVAVRPWMGGTGGDRVNAASPAPACVAPAEGTAGSHICVFCCHGLCSQEPRLPGRSGHPCADTECVGRPLNDSGESVLEKAP